MNLSERLKLLITKVNNKMNTILNLMIVTSEMVDYFDPLWRLFVCLQKIFVMLYRFILILCDDGMLLVESDCCYVMFFVCY